MEGTQRRKSNIIHHIVTLHQILKKWQKVANARRVAASLRRALVSPCKHCRRPTASSAEFCRDSDHEERSYVPPDVPAGHLAVYVGSLRRRFVIKVTLLNEPLFRALLEKAADEFGFDHQGGIIIPCEPAIFEYVLRLFSRNRSAVKNVKLDEILSIYNNNNNKSRFYFENDFAPLLYATA